MYKLLSLLFKLVLIILVPFVLLIRLAVYLHTSSNLSPWLCILASVLMTILVIFIYLTIIHSYISDHDNIYNFRRRIIVSIVIVSLYAIHGLFYIKSENMKSKDLRKEIHKVHPVLRLAASTLIHLDKELIITDSDRLPEDYKKMGLKSIKNSLHYTQSTGYSHALDLRTRNRPAWKNMLVQSYFYVMGFQTLRHTGTADHLHVSLMSHDRPWAK